MTEDRILLEYNEQGGNRLDRFLVERLPAFSRSRLQQLIRDGSVMVNGKPAKKAGQILERPTTVSVCLPAPESAALIPEEIPLDLVFEDKNLIVINKPAGMVVHPAAGHASGTLVQAALAHSPELSVLQDNQRPGIVHRLDKNTSGLIIIAKNAPAQRWLQDQFRARRVEKIYVALVDGHPPTPEGRIETPIGRSPTSRKRMAVVVPQKGRSAITEYRTLEKFSQHSYLEVRPITGRMHQIRIHLDFIGCPVVGDTIYGLRKPSIPIKRHFLHAARLSITLPGEIQPRTFEADLPEELTQLLEDLKQNQ
ncbi:MAG: RluA family pseudouridine synthase [Anaerolineales bacterium]